MPKNGNWKRKNPRWHGILRRLRKMTVWFFAMILIFLGILALAGWIVFRNPTALANRLLTKLPGNFAVSLEKLDLSRRGKVRMDGVTVTELLPRKHNPLVAIEGVDLGYDLGELRREGKVRRLRLDGPVLRLDETTFSRESDPAGDAPPNLGELARKIQFLGRIAEGLEVREGRVEIDLPGLPEIAFDWDLNSEALDFSGAEWLSGKPVELRLDNIRVGEGEGMARLGRVAVDVRVRGDLGGIEVEALEFEAPHMRLTPEMWAPDYGAPRGALAADPARGAPGKDEDLPAAPGFDIVLKSLRIRNGWFELLGFDGLEGRPALPDVGFHSTIEWDDLRYREGRVTAGAPLALRLDNIEVGAARSAVAEMLASVRGLELRFSPQDLLERRRIESIVLDAPGIRWNPRSVERFFGGEDAPPAAGAAPESGSGPAGAPAPGEEISWEIGSAEIREGSVDVRGLSLGGRTLPTLAVSVEGLFQDLSIFGNGKVVSGSRQEIRLRRLQIENPEALGPDAVPLAEIAEMRAGFRIPELLEQNRVEELTIVEPTICLTDETFSKWLVERARQGPPPAVAGEGAPENPPTGDGEKEGGWLPWKVDRLQVSGGSFRLDTDAFGDRLPEVMGQFDLETLPQSESGDGQYRATFREIGIRARESREGEEIEAAESRVAVVPKMEVDFSARGLQVEKRVERVDIEGAVLNVGAGLGRLVKGGEQAEETATEAEPEPAIADDVSGQTAAVGESWRIGDLRVSGSQVRFEALIPQIQGLEFDVSTSLREVPFSRDGLLADHANRKVELAGIELRDPYDSFIKVAELPTIFVEFTLAGLANQRIDKIDLIGPVLYVGQGLFWWVDYQRHYRQRNEGGALADKPGGDPATGQDKAEPSWDIDRINAHFGKLVIAPTGPPIGAVPFPFHARTNLEHGNITLDLEIPDEEGYVYEFPGLKLKLFGLRGKVDFNVPIKQKDNNLVQWFELDRAVWKQYEAEKVFLEVTHDARGIYGKFGGNAYSGYVEGQFNVYLDDLGRWDAWIAGSEMDMAPITQALTPENFLMDGKVNARLVSEGRRLDFGETWGDVETLTPGQIDFSKLDKLIEGLPEAWPKWKTTSTRLGLETLKRFDYDTGRGDLYFVGRDGWLRLDLEGPTGSRVFNLYAHDWRKTNGGASEAGETRRTGEAAPETRETAKNEGVN